ncbi:hypothetical protein U1Q18_014207 [Sarracenia purpurea var. burkii]
MIWWWDVSGWSTSREISVCLWQGRAIYGIVSAWHSATLQGLCCSRVLLQGFVGCSCCLCPAGDVWVCAGVVYVQQWCAVAVVLMLFLAAVGLVAAVGVAAVA